MKYSKDHEWVRMEGDDVIVGISNYAQDSLGDIVYVDLPEPGDQVIAGEVFGDLESIKAVSDLMSPVTGEVLAINEQVLDSPELLNSDAEGTWLIRVGNAELGGELMDEAAYQDFLKTL